VMALRDLNVSAVDLYRRHRSLGSVSAVIVTFCVVFVAVRRIASARATPVELAVPHSLIREDMPVQICHICLKERRTAGKGGRRLIRVPLEVTQHYTFKRKGMPTRLCSHCDGEAYENIMDNHNKRIGGNDVENDA